MRLARTFSWAFLFLVFSTLPASRAVAQAPLEPAQLPANTSFYIIWRGTPEGDARKNNALLSLWDDPGFAPVRAGMVEALMNDSKKQKDKPGLTHEEIAQFATLLDNPFTVGYLPRREAASAKGPAAKAGASATASAPQWNGMFFVYNRTGKEDLLSKAVLRMRANSSEIPKLTELTIAGVPALKIERKSSSTITYWAETGKYAVSANEESVFEEVLKRLSGKAAVGSLAESEAYREAKPLLTGGFVEFFLRVPQIKDLAGGPDTAAPQMKALWNGIRLDAIHVFAGHVSVEGSRTRLQGAILGNTSEASLFDIWGEGWKQPASLAYVTPDTVYYHTSQINLLGIYKTLKRALLQAGPDTTQMEGALEGMAQTRIGMPLTDAFALVTGEFGSLQSSPALDPDKKIFFAGIANKPDALKLTRSILGDRITSERNEGNVTYLKISLKGSQGSQGVAQWSFYHLAVTPNFLLGATKSDTLRNALANAPPAGDPSLPKNLVAARSQFPERLNGFTYFDLQKLDWPALKQQWTTEVTKAVADSKTPDAAQKSKHLNDWLANVDPTVFPKHLHSVTGASWKDASGIHFDQWVD